MKIRPKTTAVIFILSFLLIELFTLPAPACTTFCFKNQGACIFGRNYDWETGNCLLIVNKRGVAKRGILGNNPARWISRYGSITFNQYGRELPLGGMNEAQLVIECMWLDNTIYPTAGSREELMELQWIQYQLDNFATIEEVLASDKKVRITTDSSPLHFLVCDGKGHAAVIEFLDGKMKSYTGKTLPYPALANSTYEQSMKLMKLIQGNNASETLKRVSNSHERFARAALGVTQWKEDQKNSPLDYAFGILDKVTVDRTMWSIVYDTKNRRIYYRTWQNRRIRTLHLTAFDFSCQTPVKILDIRFDPGPDKSDVTNAFFAYSTRANYNLIKKSYSETYFLKDRPETNIQQVAQYPETLPCKK